MKKILTTIFIVILVFIIIFSGYLIVKNFPTGYLIIKNIFKSNALQTTKPENVVIDNWSTYNNSQLGLEIIYPTGFVTEENMIGYPKRINFQSNLVKLGSFFGLTIYNIQEAKEYGASITDNQSVPKVSYNSNTPTTTENIVTNNISIQITKQGQEHTNITFIHGQNAYRLDWECWPKQACFNNQIIEKIVSSIKFDK
ncbi:MAG: hypothetical protein NT155_02665 [Candidatus Staskawiczbacteria bacterium]|nr:hypothetical protein [Candidatus Staskawiczbacteria bacterium]